MRADRRAGVVVSARDFEVFLYQVLRSRQGSFRPFFYFLSATEYHSDADYNLRRLGVVVVVVVVVVSILKNG